MNFGQQPEFGVCADSSNVLTISTKRAKGW